MLTSYRDSHDPAPSDWLLAIDTSSERAGLALFDGERLHEMQWPADRRQTTEAMPRVDALLSSAGVTIEDVAAIAVATGPGTFTGLRVGMAIAKGLAMARSLPIVGVPTLQATGLPWLQAGMDVVAVLPAGRGRLVWQYLRPAVPDSPPVNGTPPELLEAVGGTVASVIVGELPERLRSQLEPASVPVLCEPGMGSRIGAIALIGWNRAVLGEHDELATLEPQYVHGTAQAVRSVRDASP